MAAAASAQQAAALEAERKLQARIQEADQAATTARQAEKASDSRAAVLEASLHAAKDAASQSIKAYNDSKVHNSCHGCLSAFSILGCPPARVYIASSNQRSHTRQKALMLLLCRQSSKASSAGVLRLRPSAPPPSNGQRLR